MSTFTKIPLASGAGIIQLAGFSWVTVHETSESSNIIDELWLWVKNSSSAEEPVIIAIGDSSDTGNQIPSIVPGNSIILVVPGIPVSGDGTSSRTISANGPNFMTADNLSVTGYVNRITP